ncbi:MAG: pyridoxamine 5'-phosphate oxidase family protein [Bacteroidia bacterium]
MRLIKLAKEELLRSNVDRKHPFKLFSLASFGKTFPEVRTVVKRSCDENFNLLVYSDRRTPKVSQVQKNTKVTALFYHPKKKLQVRIKANCQIVDENDSLYLEHFHKVKSSANTMDYRTNSPPGSPIEESVIYNEKLNFCLLKLIPQEIEVLQLKKEQHQRAKYTLKNEQWLEQKLVP